MIVMIWGIPQRRETNAENEANSVCFSRTLSKDNCCMIPWRLVFRLKWRGAQKGLTAP